jgi:hypothetical protein
MSKPGRLRTLDDLEPHRPVRVDQHIHLLRLHEERSVPDPGDADLAFASFGKSGASPAAARFVKSDGMRTLVRKLRLCQSALGRRPTRVESASSLTPDAGITFFRLFLEKGIGTSAEAYNLARVNQTLRAGERRR